MPIPLVPLVITGLGALSGALAGRKKTSTQTQQQDLTTTGTTSQQYQRGGTTSVDTSTMPVLSPQQQMMQKLLFSRYGDLLGRDIDLSGYTAEGLRNVNRVGDIRNRLLQNTLASRGLQFSNVAPTALASNENVRLGEALNLINSIPMLREQIEQGRLSAAGQFLASTPTGQQQIGTTTTDETGTTTGTTNQRTTGTTTGTATAPSDILGGLVGGLGQGIASTYGYSWALDQLRRSQPQVQQGNVSALMQPPTPTPPNLTPGVSYPLNPPYTFGPTGQPATAFGNSVQSLTPAQINDILSLLGMIGGR